MKTRLEVKHKNRTYVCDVTYTGCPSCFGTDDINIQCVRVLEIRLSDDTAINREWFADRGQADMVDFLLWDIVEWNSGRLLNEN
jgi:hypothetical protein